MLSINTTQYIVLYRFDWCVYNNMDSDHLMCQPSYPDRLNSRQKEEDWKKKSKLSAFFIYCVKYHRWNKILYNRPFPVLCDVISCVYICSACFCFLRIGCFLFLFRAFEKCSCWETFTCNDVCGELWLVRVLFNTYVYMLC